ncbi:hypothetical protein H6P81_008139 [Aristolochia fimbriata]|uniref:Uncharacterized protein n=1 Tax=Aristolochia fimbriata TaxID=158543 RepID=A0AAV7F266_ARIFI|nr:hypothetical protein H6P81_008139 [Aristolochia fimbriata]
MLCSIKSNSDWLHRLRASKGFPAESALDLENFLSSSPNPDPLLESRTSASIPSADDSKRAASLPEMKSKNSVAQHSCEKDQWVDIMNNVLAELFNMGGRDYPKMQALKSARKQPNPKICVISTSTSMQDSCMLEGQIPAMSPSSADNSVAEAKDGGKESGFVEAEEEISQAVGADVDSDLFSRTVVTIIDTSAPNWKSEKLLLRKKNVWKIRDKKRKLVDTSRKKRKLERSGPSGGCKKKPKKRNLLQSNEASSDCKRREVQLQLSGGKHSHDDKKETCRSMQDDRSRFTKRVQSCRSSQKLAKRDVSAVHIKPIPTSKKNGAHSKMNIKDKH